MACLRAWHALNLVHDGWLGEYNAIRAWPCRRRTDLQTSREVVVPPESVRIASMMLRLESGVWVWTPGAVSV